MKIWESRSTKTEEEMLTQLNDVGVCYSRRGWAKRHARRICSLRVVLIQMLCGESPKSSA